MNGYKRAYLYADTVAAEARLATRFAILSGDEVLLPAASFFESDICEVVIRELEALFPRGLIWLVGGAANIEEFIYRKLLQYDPSSSQYRKYAGACLERLPPFRARHSSATNDIKTHWASLLDEGDIVKDIVTGTNYRPPSDFESRWQMIPDYLEDKAFIVPYVAPALLGDVLHPTITNRLHAIINEAYFASYVNEFAARTVGDLVYLASPHGVPSRGMRIPFRRMAREVRASGLMHDITRADASALLDIKATDKWAACLTATMTRIPDVPILLSQSTRIPEIRTMQGLRSFIVHGHDDTIKLELKDYLQNTLLCSEPTILHQQPNRGRTIIEKFEECSQDVDVAFVLLTPDDIGGLSTDVLRDRARQNVVFELGVFVGRFGRTSGRVILLHKGDLELPSDLAGVVYIDVSNGIAAAGEDIRKELQGVTRRSNEDS